MTVATVLGALLAASAVTVAVARAPRRGPMRIVVPGSRPGFVDLRQHLRTTVPSRAREVATLASALAAELRSGRQPQQAWRHVIGQPGVDLPGVAVPGGDVVVVLTRWCGQPGWSGLAAIAVCWRLADTSGAGLAEALDRVSESMRHEQDVASEVHGQLASTRATAVVLATLPLVALVMGSLLGADPLGVLLGSWIGSLCLISGLALVAAGSWWVATQVAAVRRLLQWQ